MYKYKYTCTYTIAHAPSLLAFIFNSSIPIFPFILQYIMYIKYYLKKINAHFVGVLRALRRQKIRQVNFNKS